MRSSIFDFLKKKAGRDVLSTTRAHSYQQGKDDRTGFRIACSRLSGTTGPLPYVPSDGVVSALTGWSIHASNLRHVPSGIFTMGTDDAVSIFKAKERASRMEHCNYRHSNFY